MPVKSTKTEQLFDILSDDDMLVSELTARDLIAILHKTPVSNKPWLNNLLK